MAQRKELNIELGLTVKKFDQALKRTERKLERFSRGLSSFGRDLSVGLTAPLALVGREALKTFGEFDRLEKGLAALQGSTTLAKKQFDDLVNVVRDTRTTLDFRDTVRGALQLQAVGLSADFTTNALKQLGIAATVAGASSKDVGEVTRQLSQAVAKGRVLQQDLRIILERIPSLAGILTKEFGTITAEGLRNAGVSANDFVQRLIKAIEVSEEFQNVEGGLAKEFETFQIELQIAAKELGEVIDKSIGVSDILRKVSDAIANIIERFKRLSSAQQLSILRFAAFTAAAGPALVVIGALLRNLTVISSVIRFFSVVLIRNIAKLFAFSTAATTAATATKILNVALVTTFAGAVIAGVGLLVSKFISFSDSLNRAKGEATQLESTTESLARIQEEAARQTAKETREVDRLIDTYNDATLSENLRLTALRRLKAEYPKYFGEIDNDITKTEELSGAKLRLSEAILKANRARKLAIELSSKQKLLDAAEQAQLDAKLGIGDIEKKIGNFDGFNIFTVESAREQLKLYDEVANKVRDIGPSGLLGGLSGDKNLQIGAKQADQLRQLVDLYDQYQNTIKQSPEIIAALQAAVKGLSKENDDLVNSVKKLDNSFGNDGLTGDVETAGEKLQEVAEQTGAWKALLDAGQISQARFTKEVLKLNESALKTFIRDFPKNGNEIVALNEKVLTLTETLKNLTGEVDLLRLPGGNLNQLPVPGLLLQNTPSGLGNAEEVRSIVEGIGDTFSRTNEEIENAGRNLAVFIRTLGRNFKISEAEANRFANTLFLVNDFVKPLTGAFDDFFTAIIKGAPNAFKAFTDAIQQAFKDAIVELVKLVVLTAILTALGGAGGAKSFKEVFKLVTAFSGGGKGQGGIFGALFGGGLAEGGIVPPGYPNDSFAARLTSGEAVIPLDRLKEFIPNNDTSTGYIAETRISGDDLRILVKRAEKRGNRIY